MKLYLSTLISLIILSAPLSYGQNTQPTIADDFKPSTLNQPGQEYPQVNSQGYARFRIKAPQRRLSASWRMILPPL